MAHLDNNALVQIIAVVPGDYLETVSAAALASGLLLPLEPSGVWEEWLETGFRKSVRRMKPGQVEALSLLPGTVGPYSSAKPGGKTVSALAYKPVHYNELPKPLKRLQVSGFPERAPGEASEILGIGLRPRVFLNKDLGLSMGKASAAAAHALNAWLLEQSPEARRHWCFNPSISLETLPLKKFPKGATQIPDNGHTEVEPGSITAAVVD